METSLYENFVRTFGLIVVITIILFIGWNEPLKYRFMSQQEIAQLENPDAPKSWIWEKKVKALDRGPYGASGGSAARPQSYR